MVFVLVHSPLVGPSTWSPVGRELERRGHRAVVPSLLGPAGAPTRDWRHDVEAARAAAYDNAVAESLFASLEKDLLRRRPFPTRAEARTAVFDYIETFYNPIRLHSKLGYLSPVDHEQMEFEERTESSLVTPRSAPGLVESPQCPGFGGVAAVDPVPCGPVSRFGRPSTMIREVVHGTEGVSGGVPSAGA
jgi:Integrase core domain